MSAPAAAPAPRPGWTTSEFWATVLVHLMGLIATVLAILGRGDDGLQAVEAAVPVIALVVSGVLTYAYSRSRSRAKLEHIAAFCHGLNSDLARISPLLERDARALEPIAGALDPAALARLRAASAAWEQAEAR